MFNATAITKNILSSKTLPELIQIMENIERFPDLYTNEYKLLVEEYYLKRDEEGAKKRYIIDYTLKRLIKEWDCLQIRYQESNGFITCERLQKLARDAQKLVGEDLLAFIIKKPLDERKQSFLSKSKKLLKTLQVKTLPESTFTERCFLLQWLLTELIANINESALYKTLKE